MHVLGADQIQMWIFMSLFMMGPIAVYLAWKNSREVTSAAVMVIGFAIIWALAAVPVQLLHEVIRNVQANYAAFALWTIAGAYQFSRMHSSALSSCVKYSGSNSFRQGLHTGWQCLVACGLLKIAMMWTLPMNVGVMLACTLVMFFQVIHPRQMVISRSIGLVGGIYGLGILFLASPVMQMGTVVIHHHG